MTSKTLVRATRPRFPALSSPKTRMYARKTIVLTDSPVLEKGQHYQKGRRSGTFLVNPNSAALAVG